MSLVNANILGLYPLGLTGMASFNTDLFSPYFAGTNQLVGVRLVCLCNEHLLSLLSTNPAFSSIIRVALGPASDTHCQPFVTPK